MKIWIDNLADERDDETILRADGLDEAAIGFAEGPTRIVYSVKRVIEKLMADGMTKEEAVEYFDFNIEGAHMGEHSPLWVYEMNE